MMEQVKKDTPFKQWLFHVAFKLKLAALKAGSPWDKARGAACQLSVHVIARWA